MGQRVIVSIYTFIIKNTNIKKRRENHMKKAIKITAVGAGIVAAAVGIWKAWEQLGRKYITSTRDFH